MSIPDPNPCPHGIPHEQRKRDGCRKCDAQAHDEFLAAQEAARFRARVIQTARALLPQYVGDEKRPWEGTTADEIAAREALVFAEVFERAADEYLKGGGK